MTMPLGYGNVYAIRRVFNGDTVSILVGQVAVWLTSASPAASFNNGASVILCATNDSVNVAGIALDNIAPGEWGEVCQEGDDVKVRVDHGASAGVQVAANESIDAASTGNARQGTGTTNRFGYALTGAAQDTVLTGAPYFIRACISVTRLNTAFGRA